jgi:hypothetical protein
MQQYLIALHYHCQYQYHGWVVGLGILIGGSTLHHCQSVIKVLVNSAMLPENLPTPTAFGGVAVSLGSLHEAF